MHNELRPKNFNEFIGQEKLKESLKVVLASAKKRNKTIDHILLYGAPGLGKTSLATIIANEMGSNIRYAQGPLFDKKADILALLGSIRKGDIVFIDEVHSINKGVEELLFSAIEDFVMDLTIGPEGDSKIVRIKLPKFTLIGATTQISKISKPLRDRFGIVSKLNSYTEKDIEKILLQTAKKLQIGISESALTLLASSSQDNPRQSINLLKRVYDFAIIDSKKEISLDIVKKSFKTIGLYKWGLTDQHLDYLKALQDNVDESYASIDLLSGLLLDSKDSIEKNIEPILINKSLIVKSSRGRKLTTKGINFLTTYNL